MTYDEIRNVVEQSDLFDADLYRRLNPDIARVADPLDHYIRRGGFECRRAHHGFDPRWYVGRYADVARSGLHPLVHYLKIGRNEGRSGAPQQRLIEVARTMIAEAEGIEQDIVLERGFSDPGLLQANRNGMGGAALWAWQRIFDALPEPYDYVVFAPWLVKGGADVAVVNIVRAAVEQHGPESTLLVLADYDRNEALDWLPAGARVLCFSHFEPALTHADRVQLAVSLIYALHPKAVINVNSAACWDAMAAKAGALNQITRLFACLFCSDYDSDGRPGGYADRYFRDALPYLTRLYSDNATFNRELIARHRVPAALQSKFAVFRQPPVTAPAVQYHGGPQGGRSVLWAGRFCRQKNIELLMRIAEQMPEFRFDIFGYGDEAHTATLERAARQLPNLVLKGRYPSFASLPVNDYNVFLYTSQWDGLPNTLIEAGAVGMPVVASDVGGIAELISDDTGWLVRERSDPAAYAAALRQACDMPDMASARAQRLMALVQTEHTREKFAAALNESPSFLAQP